MISNAVRTYTVLIGALLSLTGFSAGQTPAAAQSNPAAVAAQADALVAALKDASQGNAELQAALQRLQETLNELEAKSPGDAIGERAHDLQRLLGLAKEGIPMPARRALLELASSIDVVENSEPAAALERRGASIGALIAADTLPKSSTVVKQSVRTLVDQLLALEAVVPVEAIQRRTVHLMTLLSAPEAPKKMPEVITALRPLHATVEPLIQEMRPRVNVISAIWGDTRYLRGSRVCAATRAVRGACQGNQKCTLPEAFETSVCGFDPAPFAEVRWKGVRILYECVSETSIGWDRIAENPGRVNPSPPNEVILRGSKEQIICSPGS